MASVKEALKLRFPKDGNGAEGIAEGRSLDFEAG